MPRIITTDIFREDANKVHGGKYGYDNVIYVHSYIPVKLYCKKCKKFFEQQPVNHLQGKGCPCCAINRTKSTAKIFINNAKRVHGGKYGYDNVIYVHSRTPVKIYCKKCKKFFEQQPTSHLQGKGCPCCVINQRKSTTKTFINNVKGVHGDIYEYDNVIYVHSRTPVKIYCKKCKKFFEQQPASHLRGHGCPHCVHRISKPELEFLKYCKVPNKPTNRQVRIKRYKVDGMIKSKRKIFEFLGSFYHGDSMIYNRTDIHPIFKKTYGELYDNTIKRFNHLLDLRGHDYIIKYAWGSDWTLYKNGVVTTPVIKTFKFGQTKI